MTNKKCPHRTAVDDLFRQPDPGPTPVCVGAIPEYPTLEAYVRKACAALQAAGFVFVAGPLAFGLSSCQSAEEAAVTQLGDGLPLSARDPDAGPTHYGDVTPEFRVTPGVQPRLKKRTESGKRYNALLSVSSSTPDLTVTVDGKLSGQLPLADLDLGSSKKVSLSIGGPTAPLFVSMRCTIVSNTTVECNIDSPRASVLHNGRKIRKTSPFTLRPGPTKLVVYDGEELQYLHLFLRWRS